MTQQLLLFVCAFAVLMSGLIAGVFLTFSDFVMKALSVVPPKSGIESMQLINRKVYGSLFLVLLVAMSAFSVLLSGYAIVWAPASVRTWIIAGTVSYLAGVFLVTVFCNVPMNKRLDVMDANGAETAAYWAKYLSSWTLWNHVRTVSSGASALCLLVSCILLGRGMAG